MPQLALNIKIKVLSHIRSPQLSFHSYFQPQIMTRPPRDTQTPLKHREKSSPRLQQANNQSKRRRIDPKAIGRNDVDQALTVIAAAPECSDEPPTLIPTELPQFETNYVQNRAGYSQCFILSELNFFEPFFSI